MSKGREELTRDFNIQERVVMLLEEEITKNKEQLAPLGIPYDTVEALKELFEDVEEKLSASEAMEIKQSLPAAVEYFYHKVRTAETNRVPGHHELLAKFKLLRNVVELKSHELGASSLLMAACNILIASERAQKELVETKVQLEELGGPMVNAEQNENEQLGFNPHYSPCEYF